ncbi:antitoxin [Mycobacterium sp. TNTM28]|uniref:Antitoxin n=1 Tax=[Mycobacterium] fortunisiensis TaxID=2600579 RepID=A0ABS6KS45_9MYCO|nr:antitoxin [[Mycobacterium] fortunisiensis]MBU9766473.1 antitoxin [[Mycobacterium] fortunisiensis]
MTQRQIAIRLDSDLVSFVDGEVAAQHVSSRAELISRALRRERRRLEALRDAAIYRATADQPDDLDQLASWAAHAPMDID